MSNKRDINAVVQLLGMLGIIISLIFVGLEMRQSQRIAIAGQYQARAAMNADKSGASGLPFGARGPGAGFLPVAAGLAVARR